MTAELTANPERLAHRRHRADCQPCAQRALHSQSHENLRQTRPAELYRCALGADSPIARTQRHHGLAQPRSQSYIIGAMNILSIQSWVAYGHVGNASAVFPLQRLGAEVWSINTVQFSNHTGYGHWTGQVYTGDAVRELVDGIAARDVLRHCDAVLSGYMGDAGIGGAILHAVTRVRVMRTLT